MPKLNRLPVYYLVFFIVMIIVNVIASGDVSDVANKYDTLIQPAGYAFAIWSIIYIALLAWIIRMLVVKNSRDKIQISLQWMPTLNFLLNSIWIIVFTQEWLLVSNLVIITIWLTLFWMYKEVGRHDYHWLDRLPLSLYFGWITLATVVNIFTYLEKLGVRYAIPFEEPLVITLVLGAVAIIIMLASVRSHDWAIPLVALWTYFAIMMNAGTDYTPFYAVIIIANIIFILAALTNYMSSKERYLEYRKTIF